MEYTSIILFLVLVFNKIKKKSLYQYCKLYKLSPQYIRHASSRANTEFGSQFPPTHTASQRVRIIVH